MEKVISNDINIVQYDDNRILGLEIKTNDLSLLFLCIYLPYECDAFYDDYCFYLNKLQCIIESSNTPYTFAIGDYNANIKSESVFGSEITEFCDLNNLCFKRIISCIKCAESESIPSKPTQSKFKAIPGWNDYVKEHHAVARDALWW